MKRTICFSCLIFMMAFLISCGNKASFKSSTYEEGFVEGEDYDPSQENFMYGPRTIAYSDQALYFNAGAYIFITDPKTMQTQPFCYRSNCLHNLETDQSKVADCNAFTGTSLSSFLAYYRNHLIVASLDKSTNKRALIQMDTDGGNRKVILPDLEKIQENRISLHRGVIYYFVEETDLDGNQECSLFACSLLKPVPKPIQILNVSGNAHGIRILPAGNHVYADIITGDSEDPSNSKNTIYDLDIRSGDIAKITDEETYTIFGFRGGSLILRDSVGDFAFYEYKSETGIVKESNGLNAFLEQHPELHSFPSGMTDDLVFYNCIDLESGQLLNELLAVDNSGDIICRLEGENFGHLGERMVILDGSEYYIHYSESRSPFTVNAYKKEDILNGIADAITLLYAEDYQDINPPYIISISPD